MPPTKQSKKIIVPVRVAAPSEPICFQNPHFKLSIEQIFPIFFNYLPADRIFISGGCLSRTYIDSTMSKGHQQSFGDIDFKLPLCSLDEIRLLLHYLKWFQAIDGDTTRDPPCTYPAFVLAFNHILSAGGVLKTYYSKNKKTVVNIDWYGVTVDFVAFEESIEQHAMGLDLSIGAGFYNPYMKNIYFPCDEYDESYDRSAKDFQNKELNLVFPKRYVSILEEDPIRILRIIQAISRSDFTLSKELEFSIQQYIKTHQHRVFININPDRFYHNLKTLFFSGHAVSHLKKIIQFNLFEELFGYVRTQTAEDKARTMYLVRRVAAESDDDFLLSPSLLFYAVYWNAIKHKPFSPYTILDLSSGMIRIPIARLSNTRDDLNETIHRENIAYLTAWEQQYCIEALTHNGNLIIAERNRMLFVTNNIKKTGAVKPSALYFKTRTKVLDCIPEETNEVELPVISEYAVMCERAKASLHIGKYKEAKGQFHHAIKLNPSLPDAYYGLGYVAQQQAEHYNAPIQAVVSRLNLFKSAIKKNKSAIAQCTQEHQTYLQHQMKQYLQVVAFCEQALARRPNHIESTQLLRVIGEAVKRNFTAFPEPIPAKVADEIDNLIPFVSRSHDVLISKKALNPKMGKILPANEHIMEKKTLDKPSNNGQYDHDKTILQRGESDLKLGRLKEAIENFDGIIQRYIDAPHALETWESEIMVRTYIYRAKSLHQLASLDNDKIWLVNGATHKKQFSSRNEHKKTFKDPILQIREKERQGKHDYAQAQKIIETLGPDFNNYLIMIYLGLGEIERFEDHAEVSTIVTRYYEATLSLIDENIQKNKYDSADSIYQEFYHCAEYISGEIIQQLHEILLRRSRFYCRESDMFFMNFSKKIYVKSLLYSPDAFQHAHIRLIQVDLILKQYDDAIVKLNTLLIGSLKNTESCQRELWLLLGECYERQSMHDIAIEYYKKAILLHYDDDNHQRQKWVDIATNAIQRIEASKCSSMPSIMQMVATPTEPSTPSLDLDPLQEGTDAFNKGEYEKAMACYTRAIQNNPYSLECYILRIQSCMFLTQSEQAMIDCDFLLGIQEDEYNLNYKAHQKEPLDQYAYLVLSARCHRGFLHLVRSQQLFSFDESQSLVDFDYTIKQAAKFNTEYFQLIASYALNGTGQHFEAKAQALRAQHKQIDMLEKTHQAKECTAEILNALNKKSNERLNKICDLEEEAISAYQRAIEHSRPFDPKTIAKSPLPEAYRGLGNVAKSRGEFILEKDAKNKKEVREGLRQMNRAERYYLQAIELDPKLDDVYLGLGCIEECRCDASVSNQEDMGKHLNAAKAYFLKSLQYRPNSTAAIFRLAKIEQIQGNSSVSKQYYMRYFLMIRTNIEMNVLSISPTEAYDLYVQMADKIIAGNKIELAVKRIFFPVDDACFLNELDLSFMDLLICIYSEAAGLVSGVQDAHFKLISIAIILEHYDEAIARIQALFQKDFTQVKCSTRELYYICAKLYEMEGNPLEAKKYCIQASSLKQYHDDDDRTSQIISCAKGCLKQIIAADVFRARDAIKYTTGIAELNMFATPARASLIGEEPPSSCEPELTTPRI